MVNISEPMKYKKGYVLFRESWPLDSYFIHNLDLAGLPKQDIIGTLPKDVLPVFKTITCGFSKGSRRTIHPRCQKPPELRIICKKKKKIEKGRCFTEPVRVARSFPGDDTSLCNCLI